MKNLTDIEHLENFILRNPELDQLENLLSEFNFFETLNLVHAEIRHSSVLAWLLDPDENHGLSSYFLRQFLKYIATENRAFFDTSSLSLFDFELFNYGNVEVRREWNKIDLLVTITENNKKVVIAIENKIKTTEHSNQLQRYREIIERDFKDHTKLYVYLTPENLLPSDEEWIPFNYEIVAKLLDDLIEHKKTTLNPNIHLFISQYLTILRRYIVGNSEVEKIAVDIYKKHKQALDIIFQYKPDVYLGISNFLIKKLQDLPNVSITGKGKTVITFIIDELDKHIEKLGDGTLKSDRIIGFEFNLYDSRVFLKLHISPGDSDYRMKLYDFFKQYKIFNKANRKLGAKWHTVYLNNFLRKKDFEDDDHEVMLEKIDKKFTNFVENDLPTIHSHFENNWN